MQTIQANYYLAAPPDRRLLTRAGSDRLKPKNYYGKEVAESR